AIYASLATDIPSFPFFAATAATALYTLSLHDALPLAMIALAAPAALLNAAPGWGTRLVAGAVVVTFMASYALFRDWERFGPLLLRHPTLLALYTLFGALLLVSARPGPTLAYARVCP